MHFIYLYDPDTWIISYPNLLAVGWIDYNEKFTTFNIANGYEWLDPNIAGKVLLKEF